METLPGEEPFKYALAMIEVYSRKAFLHPLKTKRAEDVVDMLAEIVSDIQEMTSDPDYVKALYGDNDFAAQSIRQFCTANHIHLRTYVADHTHNARHRGGDPLGILNRFAGTIKHFLRVSMINEGHGD